MKTGTLAPASNAATWQEDIEFYDDDDGSSFDLADVEEITIRFRDPDTTATALTGTLSGGDMVVVGADADGVVRATFSATAMAALQPKTYEIGVLIEDADGFVTQTILGRIPILNGL